MGIGSFFGKLLGSGEGKSEASTAAEPVEHKGLYIVPEPIKEGSQYRTAGYIERREGDSVSRTQFIRADNHTSLEAAVTHAVSKGKQIIDEQGESVLSRDHA